MAKHFLIIQMLFAFQMIYFTSTRNIEVISIGKEKYSNIHFFSDGNHILMETSRLPIQNVKIVYDINQNFFNVFGKGKNGTLEIPFEVWNIPYDADQSKYGFSGQSILVDNKWFSISRNGYIEIYNVSNANGERISIQDYFFNLSFTEFSDIVIFHHFESNLTNISYIFPCIYDTDENFKVFMLFVVGQDNIFDFGNRYANYEKPIAKGNVASCFEILNPHKLLCLIRNESYYLVLEVFSENIGFLPEAEYTLNQTNDSPENENISFKGIPFKENACVLAYYTDYNDEYLRISVKKLSLNETNSNELLVTNYGNYSTQLIEAKNFSKHYMLNDLIKLDNDDVYFAASSIDKETLYIIIFKINQTIIDKKIITINLFQEHGLKFYNELRLVNNRSTLMMGFSHCYQKYCEEDGNYTSSLMIFHDLEEDILPTTNVLESTVFFEEEDEIEKYDFDLIKNLYDTNYDQNKPLIVDLNIYKDKPGFKFKYISFIDIPHMMELFNPKNNSKIINDVLYDFSNFTLNISLKTNGSFELIYTLFLEDSTTGSGSNLRHLVIQEKKVNFVIKIDKIMSNTCNDICSLCSPNDPSTCISCKYEYYFIGDKKFCFNENGEMNISQIGDVYDSLKDNLANQDFITIEQENAVIQYTTVKDQLTNNNKNISSINLGKCEDKLRAQENLDSDDQFIIIKIDLKNTSIAATYVQYEIYNPKTFQQVSLQVCEDSPIKINTPVSLSNQKLSLISSLEESGYNLFDIKDSFYNDICSTYTAENGADMVLSSRKNLIYDKNKDVYLCQSGCEFNSFDSKNSKAECDCKVQKSATITDIAKISFDKTQFVDSFYKTLFNSNFRVLKCIKLLFSSKGLKRNFGCYIMSTLFFIDIIFIILYSLTGQKKMTETISDVLISKGINLFEKDKINQMLEKEKNDKSKLDDTDKKIIQSKPSKNKSKKKKKSKNKKVEELQAPKKKKKNRAKKNQEGESMKDEGKLANTKVNLVNDKEGSNDTEINEKKKNKEEMDKKEKDLEKEMILQYKGLNDEEMNTLDYEVAVVIDKRSYFQYYLSLIKKKHLILFTFLPMNDYNLIPLKIILFIISFSLYFTINGFFFSDDTMNKIYEDNGNFNFLYQLPQIFYSSVISAVINMILKLLSLSEKKIIEIKKEKDSEKVKEKAKSAQKGLMIKFILFLVLSTLLMISFWYFISCFCAVYTNTQATLIKDTLISFGISMLYPFVLNLLPGLFRIPALRAPNKDQKCKYKASGYMALV